MKDQIHLGDRARDRISKFSGIVVAITEWLNGCRRITIQPEKLDGKKVVENYTFDAEQVEVIKAGAVVVAPKPVGGPRLEPQRAADPR